MPTAPPNDRIWQLRLGLLVERAAWTFGGVCLVTCGAFHEQTETALPYPIVGRSSRHSRRPPRSILRGERTRRDGVTVMRMSCARAGGPESKLVLSARFWGGVLPLRSDGDAPKSRALALDKAGPGSAQFASDLG